MKKTRGHLKAVPPLCHGTVKGEVVDLDFPLRKFRQFTNGHKSFVVHQCRVHLDLA